MQRILREAETYGGSPPRDVDTAQMHYGFVQLLLRIRQQGIVEQAAYIWHNVVCRAVLDIANMHRGVVVASGVA